MRAYNSCQGSRRQEVRADSGRHGDGPVSAFARSRRLDQDLLCVGAAALGSKLSKTVVAHSRRDCGR